MCGEVPIVGWELKLGDLFVLFLPHYIYKQKSGGFSAFDIVWFIAL